MAESKGQKSVSIGFRISKEDFERLEAIASREELSPGRVCRRLILERLDGATHTLVMEEIGKTRILVEGLTEKLAAVAMLILTQERPLDEDIARRWILSNLLGPST